MRAVLGTVLDGDLDAMTITRGLSPIGAAAHFAMSWDQLTRHTIIIGGTGTGKTVTQLRLASAVMAMSATNRHEPPVRVLFLDAKGMPGGRGSDQDTFLTIARNHNYRNVHQFPLEPLRGLDGNTHELRERLSGLFRGDESPFHHAESVTMLDLALRAGSPPRTLNALIERVTPGATAALYEQSGSVESAQLHSAAEGFSKSQWNSLYLRLKALQATIGNAMDSTDNGWSMHNADAAWISIPGTNAPQAAADIAAWILAMIGEIAINGDGRRTLIFLDEFSAIGQDPRASSAVAGLVERTRAAGVALIIGTQTVSSMGLHADRLLQTAGTVLCHRTPIPEPIVELGGTVSAWEDTQLVDTWGRRVATSGRLQQQYRISPNLVRELPVGELVAIHESRWALVRVSPR